MKMARDTFIVEWTITQSACVTELDFENMKAYALESIKNGASVDLAVHSAVEDLTTGWDDEIYYSVTEEAVDKIANELLKYMVGA